MATVLAVIVIRALVVYLLVYQQTDGHLEAQLEADRELAQHMLQEVNGQVTRVSPHRDRSGLLALVLTQDGHVLWTSSAWSLLPHGTVPPPPHLHSRTVQLADGHPYRVLDGPWEEHPDLVVRVVRDETRMRQEMNRLFLTDLLSAPLVLLLAGIAGWTMAVRALSPVRRMAAEASEIAAERLDQRLPVESSDDELGHLARVLNDTFSRLERSFAELSRFTSDASHELRTPLTAMRSVGEVCLTETRTPEEYQETIGSMLEEVERLTRLVETLLVLARGSDAHPERIVLAPLVDGVISLLGTLADEKRQTISIDADPQVETTADPTMLRQAVVNLLDNAIKYSVDGDTIAVSVRRDGHALVEVQDHGPGIPPEHLSHIFDRFYRIDRGRSREHGGTGLGLAIARWAVEANGGTIEVHSAPGQGSRFRISLP